MNEKQLKLDNLKKALVSLEKIIDQYESLSVTSELKESLRDGAIQRFEFTYELAWKSLKRFFEVYMLENVDALIGANLFRMGFEAGLISNVNIWLEFKRNRNLTSHTYDQNVAHEVYEGLKLFVPEINHFIQKIEIKINDLS